MCAARKDDMVQMNTREEAKGMVTLLEAFILQIQILTDSYRPKHPA